MTESYFSFVMSEMQNDHVSVDEAVARLMNLDFVPAPFTVLELLEGFLLEAEEKYERSSAGTDNQIERNSHCAAMKVCDARLDLGKVLVEAIEAEVKRGKLIAKSNASSVQLLSWSAVKIWAEDLFGLTVLERVVAEDIFLENRAAKSPAEVEHKDPFDKLLATWGVNKIKNFLVTFYALALNIAFSHPKTMLTSTREVQIKPLAEEIEAIVNKYAGTKAMKNNSAEAIKRRLMPAEIAWGKALEGEEKNSK